MNLQVPVLIGYEIFDIGIVSLRAQVGPTANFLLKSQTLYDNTYTLDGVEHNIDNTSTTEKFNPKSISWGFQAGLGADFLTLITLDINYNLGFRQLYKALENTELANTFNFDNIDTTKQHRFMVTVGIKLIKL